MQTDRLENFADPWYLFATVTESVTQK